ncbi:MAG: nuclear transport factor 2 family protein [Microscillaceae bacterium]|nr:nuclear transport factor 2 family protein [Microscillaceae bacterium]
MQNLIKETLDKWHQVVKNGDLALLDEILDENVVFHSPIVWTPQKGKALSKMYLSGAKYVLGTDKFHYTREVVEGTMAVLEFSTQIEEIVVEGIDFIEFNESGKIINFKVMVRPLKAMHILQEKMAEMLEKFKG